MHDGFCFLEFEKLIEPIKSWVTRKYKPLIYNDQGNMNVESPIKI